MFSDCRVQLALCKDKAFHGQSLTPTAISVKMVRFAYLWLQRSSLLRCNFASDKNKNRMKQKTELPEELCADEAVCFIAYRHHVSPQQLLRYFLYGEASIPLEANEVEILKGLSKLVKDDRITNIKTR